MRRRCMLQDPSYIRHSCRVSDRRTAGHEPDNEPMRIRAYRLARGFRRDEDGSLIIFGLMMMIVMLFMAGIPLDIERFETARTKLQNTADGAALAAAALTQEVDAEVLVLDYFAKAGVAGFVDDVRVTEAINYKHVEIDADINVPTHFFNMVGVTNLGTLVDSVAEESIGDVEISLVLDVSGSMGSNGKLGNLKNAAEDFIDAIYEDAEASSISTSVIPYSTQVSAGPDILKYLTRTPVSHEDSHCLNFSSSDFTTASISTTADVEQTLHFDPWTNEYSGWRANYNLPQVVCPAGENKEWTNILPYSNSPVALENYVNAFDDTNLTSIEIGVKWGTAMLDPSFRPVVTGLIADGIVSADFAGRPLDYDTADGLKVMVVMTDGQNTQHYEMENPYRAGDSIVYVWYDEEDRPYYSIWGGEGTPIPEEQYEEQETTECVSYGWYYHNGRYYYYCQEEQTSTETVLIENWYLVNRYTYDVSTGWRGTPYTGDPSEEAWIMTWDELWAEVPVEYFADEYLRSMGSMMDGFRSGVKNARSYVTSGTKDSRTRSICTAAKAEGIYVYTIGFEAPYNSRILLQDCATTPSHYFNVSGTQISAAFSAIAADINRLRLIQ